jgi:hypothetical protein
MCFHRERQTLSHGVYLRTEVINNQPFANLDTIAQLQ